MTCIVGIETQDGHVVIGGDRLGSNGWTGSNVTQAKIFKHSNMIFGYTSSFRFGQVVEVLFDDNRLHPPTDPDDTYHWLISCFVPALQAKLKEADTKMGTMLFGINGQLWTLQEEGSVLRSANGYDSCGSGSLHANGAMAFYSLNNPKPSNINEAEKILRDALKSAAIHVVSVSDSMDIISL